MKTWVVILVMFGCCVVGFGSGFLTGRQFPKRRFERFGESRYVLETATGKLCDPFKDPNISTNPFDHAFDSSKSVDEYLKQYQTAYPPACGGK